MDYEFVYDFRVNKHLTTELNQLIKRSCLNSTLDNWMLKGHSDSNYYYFGLIDLKGNLVAAIGLIRTSLYFRDRRLKAVQVGNVFFRHSYNFSKEQKLELERKLVNEVIVKFQTIVDVIYYYQNDDSIPLLQDFGLTKFQEHNYYIELDDSIRKNCVVRKMDLDKHSDNEELLATIKHSYQVSRTTFDISNDSVIKMYNILKHYRRNVYKIPSLGVTGVFGVKDNVFKIIATFSPQKVNLEAVINAVVPPGIKRVEFGFTPSSWIPGLKITKISEKPYKENDLSSSHLYVKAITINLEEAKVVFPLLSRQK